jgi:hypothetical protein
MWKMWSHQGSKKKKEKKKKEREIISRVVSCVIAVTVSMN